MYLGGKMKFKIYYFKYEEFKEDLSAIHPKLQAKVIKTLKIIEEKGIGCVDVKSLGEGLFEIRIKHSSNIYRVIYFYDSNQRSLIVVTHGFLKKN